MMEVCLLLFLRYPSGLQQVVYIDTLAISCLCLSVSSLPTYLYHVI
jgi:hypothetical protein